MRRRGRIGLTLSLAPGGVGGFQDPVLAAWNCTGTDDGVGGATMEFHNGATIGAVCSVEWVLKYGANTYRTAASSPDQTGPHDLDVVVSILGDRGVYHDLYWTWATASKSSGGDLLIGSGLVYVPAIGESQSEQGGP